MPDRTFAEAIRDNIEKIADSSVFVTLYSPDMAKVEEDPLPAMQLAIAILLDKPIIVAATPGRPVPRKLAAIADVVIEGGPEEWAAGFLRWGERGHA